MAGEQTRQPRRLVLCFDGTGNSFTGDYSDTNIVKIYKMCDRSSKDQWHYYQPGIGTYDAKNHDSVNKGPWGTFTSWISSLIDQGFGTSLDSHVIAGYRFLMRYYNIGDEIYMFGFSRGAFTARFLAAMIYKIGIMSKGNEELIPFAYKIYQDHELGLNSTERHENMMVDFKATFCQSGVQVHFLGLFDTVRSVGLFDLGLASRSGFVPVSNAYATFVRHAVSLDERRGKFKAALLCQNTDGAHGPHTSVDNPAELDIYVRERWFSGNHGDVGGGWGISQDVGLAPTDPVPLSDIPLGWMLREVQELPESQCQGGRLELEPKKVKAFEERLVKWRTDTLKSKHHDVLSFGGGVSWIKVIFWRILEYLPLGSRLELNKNGKWENTRWPPNCGDTRDLPACAILDRSIGDREALVDTYKPKNENFISLRYDGKNWR